MFKHKKPDGRGAIPGPPVVDFGYQFGKGQLLSSGNVLQGIPERILQADAGLVVAEYDGSLDDWELHDRLFRQGNARQMMTSCRPDEEVAPFWRADQTGYSSSTQVHTTFESLQFVIMAHVALSKIEHS
jgi:hypothetical protein